jgi:hypothetical protein
MKKLFTILTICYSLSSFAQLANGAVAPDFTATDIDGVSHSLYEDYLNQGIPVIMDISATWCPPCWNYHQTHALKDLYNIYGSKASNEVSVLFIEGDGSTPLSHLYGEGNSMGDWTEGTPYPIIDNSSIANLYQIGYYPTLYAICPDKTVYLVGSNNNVPGLLQNIQTRCGITTTGAQNNISLENNEMKLCLTSDATPRITISNHGLNTISSVKLELFEEGNSTAIETINWEGNLNSLNEATIEFSTIENDFNSDTEFIIIASMPNGNADNYLLLNEAISAVTPPNSVQNTFTVKVSTDNFGADCTWRILDEEGTTVANGGPYTNVINSTSFVLQEQEDQEVNVEQGGCYTFQVNDTEGDGMYTNQPTFFRIVDENNQQIININGDDYTSSASDIFNVGDITSISENNNTFFNVYPNPAYDMINIEFDSQFEKENATISISNMLGKEVIALNNIISNNTSIDISSLKNGIYFVNTSVKGNISTEKIVILK